MSIFRLNLFVYGTLKRGFRNNHLLGNSKFLGVFETEPKYRLFENGYFPMMWEDDKDGYSVQGEVWEVNLFRAFMLDRHEELYHRAAIDIKADLGPVHAYIYDAWPDPRLIECYHSWRPKVDAPIAQWIEQQTSNL